MTGNSHTLSVSDSLTFHNQFNHNNFDNNYYKNGYENHQHNLFKSTKYREYMKAHVVALLALVFGLSIAVAYLGYLQYGRKSTEINEEEYCQSSKCIRSAANLLNSMDQNIDPCDDFFRFACGLWPIEHPVPEHQYSTDWFSDRTTHLLHHIKTFLSFNDSLEEPTPVHQARVLYRSCLDLDEMNEKGVTPIFEILEDVGLTTLPPVNEASQNFSWVRTAALSKKLFDQDFFFTFSISSDPKNRTINRLYVGKPDGMSPLPVQRNVEKNFRNRLREAITDETINIEEEEYDEEHPVNLTTTKLKTLTSYVTSVMHVIYTEQGKSIRDEKKEDLVDSLSNLFNFTRDVDELIQRPDGENHAVPSYTTLRELQETTDKISHQLNVPSIINWKEYFEWMFKDIQNVTLDFEGTDSTILISNPEFIKEMLQILANHSTSTIEMYMWWTVVSTLVPYTTKELRSLHQDFIYSITGHGTRNSRSLYCADVVNQLMGMAVSYSLVGPFPINSTKPRVSEMVDNIQWAFTNIVQKLDWMDEQTKNATLKKAAAMRKYIGYPSTLAEEGELEEYYEGVDMEENEFLRNILQEVQRTNERGLQSLREPFDYETDNWASDPTDVNAYHWVQANAITVPAGILQFPFYSHDIEALNYGAIGTILGHELTHGFDNTGKKYDHEGNINPWWTNATSEEFQMKAECFVKHYSSYVFPEQGNAQLDGRLSLDENLADNGGVREALLAYRKHVSIHGGERKLPGLGKYSHEQLLFLSYANIWCDNTTPEGLEWTLHDEHSPNQVRVRAVLSNSKEFADIWKCKPGTPMNPEKEKCQIW